MNSFVLEIWFDEASICTFYTVGWLSDAKETASETDKFFDTYAIPDHPFVDEAFILFRLITESIGNKYGAIDPFFDRIENRAQALPPKPKPSVTEIEQIGKNFPLRLYCYRVSSQIVILFNGGIKNATSAQESENLSIKFYEAQTFVKRIEEGLKSGMIKISSDHRYLCNYDDTSEIIL